MYENLMEAVVSPENATRAWKAVKRNQGAPGIDGMTTEQLRDHIRRHVRLCYWKQWKRPGTRRRHLLSRGIRPAEVHLASRCRRGYWWRSGNGIVQRALDNTWLAEQGVPNLRQQWIERHYGKQNPLADPASVNLTGTA